MVDVHWPLKLLGEGRDWRFTGEPENTILGKSETCMGNGAYIPNSRFVPHRLVSIKFHPSALKGG